VTEPLSRCWLDTCRSVANVVLYASADKLGGLPTRPRQPVAFCLKHGGEVYDQIRAWRAIEERHKPVLRPGVVLGRLDRTSSSCPNWLVADLRNGRLPRTSPSPEGWPPASPAALNKFKPKGR
jgi:hypothetical protein